MQLTNTNTSTALVSVYDDGVVIVTHYTDKSKRAIARVEITYPDNTTTITRKRKRKQQ